VDEVDGAIGEERMAQAGGPEVVLEVGLGLGLGQADVPVEVPGGEARGSRMIR
jgi:hypothetical protein